MNLRLSIFLLLLPFLLTAQFQQHTLIFVGDTQSPIWFEKFYLQYNNNEKATQNIFSAVLKEQNVDAVIHAGDITGYGSSKSEWKPVLPFLDSLRERSIPFIAAKGNHDYMFLPSTAMKRFKEYVPSSASDYSLWKFDNVAIILLNSNFSRLNSSVITTQRKWYVSMLEKCEADTSVHFIITVDHHPPFTNSKVISGSEEVRKDFLPAFFQSKKAVLFVSGHAHRFEHFRQQGKDFLVVGGGGGLLHNEQTPPVMNDLYTGKDEGEFFHYVRCRVFADSLSFEIVKVTPHPARTEIVHHFEISAVGRKQ